MSALYAQKTCGSVDWTVQNVTPRVSPSRTYRLMAMAAGVRTKLNKIIETANLKSCSGTVVSGAAACRRASFIAASTAITTKTIAAIIGMLAERRQAVAPAEKCRPENRKLRRSMRSLLLRQPFPDPRHRLAHIGGGAGVGKAQEFLAMQRIEVEPRRRRNARLLQHALGEIDAVIGEARNVGIEIEGAVHRQETIEPDFGQSLPAECAGSPRSRV